MANMIAGRTARSGRRPKTKRQDMTLVCNVGRKCQKYGVRGKRGGKDAEAIKLARNCGVLAAFSQPLLVQNQMANISCRPGR
jgi:hypothetical protein